MSDFEASGLLMERLRARYDSADGSDLDCEAANEIERLCSRLAEVEKWDEARVKVIHELHERANKAEARLAEAEALLREVTELPLWDESVGGGAAGNRIEAFLAAESASVEGEK